MSCSDSAFIEGDEKGLGKSQGIQSMVEYSRDFHPAIVAHKLFWDNFVLFSWDISIKAKHAFLFKVPV